MLSTMMLPSVLCRALAPRLPPPGVPCGDGPRWDFRKRNMLLGRGVYMSYLPFLLLLLFTFLRRSFVNTVVIDIVFIIEYQL